MPHFWNSKELFAEAGSSLGVRSTGQLRLADRDRGRMAGAHPRRRSDAKVLSWRVPSRSSTILQGDRAVGEPLLEPNGKEREGYVPNVVYTVRRARAQWPTDHSVRARRSCHRFRYGPAGRNTRRHAARCRITPDDHYCRSFRFLPLRLCRQPAPAHFPLAAPDDDYAADPFLRS